MNPMLQPTGVVVEVRHHFCRPAHRNLLIFRNKNMTQWMGAESPTRNQELPTNLAELQFQILWQGKRPRRMRSWKGL